MFAPPLPPISSFPSFLQRRLLSIADEHEAAGQAVQKGREGAEATGGKGEWVRWLDIKAT